MFLNFKNINMPINSMIKTKTKVTKSWILFKYPCKEKYFCKLRNDLKSSFPTPKTRRFYRFMLLRKITFQLDHLRIPEKGCIIMTRMGVGSSLIKNKI